MNYIYRDRGDLEFSHHLTRQKHGTQLRTLVTDGFDYEATSILLHMVGFAHVFNSLPLILLANALQRVWSFQEKTSNPMNEHSIDGDSILDPQESLMNQG